MSADTSTLFPDRPIRPLPKRRLRERLSPEVAESIQYPPSPKAPPERVFPYPFQLRDDQSENRHPSREKNTEEGSSAPRRNGHLESGDVGGAIRRAIANRAVPDLVGRLAQTSLKTDQGRHTNSHLPLSAASSVDGYDLLENTNNKKKRKIPTAGDAALSGALAISDGGDSSNTLSTTSQSIEGPGEGSNSTSTPYYGSGSFASGAQNLSGPGRGRYGRARSGRSPLRPLSDSTNNWATRSGKLRQPHQWVPGTSENTGIISTAIANAEKLPPQQGQENMSLLHQQPSAKRGPASSQFTFTCNAQVPFTFGWSGSARRPSVPSHQVPPPRTANDAWSRGPHTSQNSHTPPPAPPAADMASKETHPRSNMPAQQPPAQRTTRRSAARDYAAAALARRRETELYNKRHPPKPDEAWVCYFCDYERIFGQPPVALVRQYEIKDRKQRQADQRLKANWEKMKKGKNKGKKSSKLPAKPEMGYDGHQGGHGAPMHSNYSQGTQSEEYEDDDYEDEDQEYDPEEELPPLEPDEAGFTHQQHKASMGGSGSTAPNDGDGT
ncbi:hypothetical protein OQA88_6338 [Cercophora sp. LCS_1]